MKILMSVLGLGVAATMHASSAYPSQGDEYPLLNYAIGDQVNPQIAVDNSGGFLVWQDNATDNDGAGISAVRLDSGLMRVSDPLRINKSAEGDQENPAVALLEDDGAVFVWQGGELGFQHIYARFMTSTNTFTTENDVLVSNDEYYQQDPAVVGLKNGNVLIVWSSSEQDGEYQGVFARLFGPDGEPLGAEFQVNRFTDFNQRTPSVEVLEDGRAVISWISEQQRGPRTFDVYARVIDENGDFLTTNEIRLNQTDDVCANPVISANKELGGFMVAWSQKVLNAPSNGWDIVARAFNEECNPISDQTLVNDHTYGDQFGPRIATIGSDNFVIWTSLRQDGSWEGVFGRFLDETAQTFGEEIQINNTTLSRQIHPCVGSDGVSRFLIGWSSFKLGSAVTDFDLFVRRYASSGGLTKPDAPYASALSQYQVSVTWPPAQGIDIKHYELYVDGADTPVVVSTNIYTISGLSPGSTHTVALRYVLNDERRSPLSDTVETGTWSIDANFDGLPDDWQQLYWGENSKSWAPGHVDSDGDGAQNIKEFLAGTDPTNPDSVLKTRLEEAEVGWRLYWNTVPGQVYQAQVSTNYEDWNDVGAPRVAAGSQDSIQVEKDSGLALYRVIRLR
ncbi:MAG: fibronectin type III domain-containing protein [Verrucomicrobia bacterium]|nr:fibronectin type III domain-containing protein [Verrucomicrobiota bacterium]